MALQQLLGFEHILPSDPANPPIVIPNWQNFLGLAYPLADSTQLAADSTAWYQDSNSAQTSLSGPMIINTDARISGSCLRIRRPYAGTNNATFNGTRSVQISRDRAPSSKITFGFAVKYSDAPIYDLPLFQITYGTPAAEQLSLWLAVDGSLLFSSIAFDLATTTVISPVTIAGTQTPAGTVNAQVWTYIELEVDYSGATPLVSMSVNAIEVLHNLAYPALMKQTAGLADTANILNPLNLYFTNGYTQYIDDIYMLDGSGLTNTQTLGPQNVVYRHPISSNSPTQWQSSIDGENKDAVSASYNLAGTGPQVNTELLETDYYGLDGLPTGKGEVRGVSLIIVGFCDLLTSVLRASLRDDLSRTVYADLTIHATPILSEGYFDYGPSGTIWSPEAFNKCDIGISLITTPVGGGFTRVFSVGAYVAVRADTNTPTALTINGEDTDMIYSDVIFPKCITYGSSGVPNYVTDKIEVSSGAEQRQQRWAYPKHKYAIQLKNMPATEFGEVLNIWHACSGEQIAFLFLDPFDHTSNNTLAGVTGTTVSATDQQIGIATGATAYYELYKVYSSGVRTKLRRIRYPDLTTLVLAIDGYTITNYTFSYATGKLLFGTAFGAKSITVDKATDAITASTGLPFVGLNVNDLVYLTGFVATADNRPASGSPLRVIANTGIVLTLQNYDGTAYTGTDVLAAAVTLTPALPPTGAVITAGYYFYTPVRFDKGDTVNATMVAGMRETAFADMSSVAMIEVFE